MGRKAPKADKAPVQAAENRFRKRMEQYEEYQYQPLDLDKFDLDLSKYGPLDASKYDLDLSKYKQENIMEDMPGMEAYTQAADYASERFQQSQANIMQGVQGAAGASGAASVAQAMSGQATEFAREQQMGLGERAAEARRLGLQEQARLQGQERQLMLQQDVGRRDLRLQEDMKQRELLFESDKARRDLSLSETMGEREFGYGKMTTLLGVEGEQLGGARQMYASQLQAQSQQQAGMMGAIGSIGGAIGGGMAAAGAFGGAKAIAACVPKGIHIDTINSSIAIENIKPGDMIVGYDGSPVKVLQKHEYLEDPTVKRFYKVKFDNGSIVNVCDMHRIKGERAMDITKNVISKDVYDGVEFSYDLLTEDAGYRISGIPVNSMIEELAELSIKLKNK